MKANITKSFTFDSAHFLPNVIKNHKCGRIHGHTFRCTLEISGEVNAEYGWVLDFGEIKKLIIPVKETLDHRFLNKDVPGLENPTSENICRWVWDRLKPDLPLLISVTLSETCTTSCIYYGS
ncbi:MAG: 6-carboxytetrahydropterin synthase QueD [Fibrobacteria bacterium]|nr:6-carboxytetrahydropterin synthase QueD [Fibrobacteria bacterium]